MNATTLIHAIQKNWSLPPSSAPTSILPSSLLSGIPIIRLPLALLNAIHALSILTHGQRDRAHSLLNTYFQARIREGNYSGKNRSIVAILEVCDVEKACDSARRMSKGREMQGFVPVSEMRRRGSDSRVGGAWVDGDEEVDGFLLAEALEQEYLDVDIQDSIATRDIALVAAPFGASLEGHDQEAGFPEQDGEGGHGHGHGHEEGEGDCITLPLLTSHTEKRRVHLPPIRTSQISTPTVPSAHVVQSSFTPLFKSLREEMESAIARDEEEEEAVLHSSPIVLPQHESFPQQQQRNHVGLGESTRRNTKFNITGSAATDHRLLAAQQSATHEFNLCRLYLQETMRQFEQARWRCEGARRRMEGLMERVR